MKSVETSLRALLEPRMNVFLRVNLDGSFRVSVSAQNPRRRNRRISVNGFSLEEVLKNAADQLAVGRDDKSIST